MKKLWVLLVLLLVPVAVYGLTCDLRTNCVPSQTLFRISDQTNAHAAERGSSNIINPQEVCCWPTPAAGFSCAGSIPEILWLGGTTNAHVSTTGSTADPIYNQPICYGDLVCQVSSGSCASPWTGVVSLSGTTNTNAHVAQYSGTGAYNSKLCCCESANYITELCGPMENPPDGSIAGCDGVDQRCCPSSTDCVLVVGANQNCYSQGSNDPSGNLVCSNNNHWCPVGFYFDGTECVYSGTYCDMGNPPVCANVFSDPVLCFDPDIPSFRPNACCPGTFSYNGYDYYEWAQVVLY